MNSLYEQTYLVMYKLWNGHPLFHTYEQMMMFHSRLSLLEGNQPADMVILNE